jgi:hypothetical protein
MESADLSTRAKRHDATSLTIEFLKMIKFAEEVYLLKYPIAMQDDGAYTDAVNSDEAICAAIDNLKAAY